MRRVRSLAGWRRRRSARRTSIQTSRGRTARTRASTAAYVTVPQRRVVPHEAEAAAMIEIWRKHYNEVRPHSSPGYLTPHEFKGEQ